MKTTLTALLATSLLLTASASATDGWTLGGGTTIVNGPGAPAPSLPPLPDGTCIRIYPGQVPPVMIDWNACGLNPDSDL